MTTGHIRAIIAAVLGAVVLFFGMLVGGFEAFSRVVSDISFGS